MSLVSLLLFHSVNPPIPDFKAVDPAASWFPTQSYELRWRFQKCVVEFVVVGEWWQQIAAAVLWSVCGGRDSWTWRGRQILVTDEAKPKPAAAVSQICLCALSSLKLEMEKLLLYMVRKQGPPSTSAS